MSSPSSGKDFSEFLYMDMVVHNGRVFHVKPADIEKLQAECFEESTSEVQLQDYASCLDVVEDSRRDGSWYSQWDQSVTASNHLEPELWPHKSVMASPEEIGPDQARSWSSSSTNDGGLNGKVVRRREQNRQSQRAYRLRKEAHCRSLEQQLAAMEAQRDTLYAMHAEQAKEVSFLKLKMQELQKELNVLRSRQGFPLCQRQAASIPQDFDAY